MNNEQIEEQPLRLGEQADNLQGNSNGSTNGAISTADAESVVAAPSADLEGTLPGDMPGDMPGPLAEVVAENAADADLANAGSEADNGQDAATDVQFAAADADAGHVETPAPFASAEARPRDASASPIVDRNSDASNEEDGTSSDELVIRQARDPRMDAVAANASMEDLLKASEQQYRTLKHNDVIEGTVMRVDRDEVLVDIGAKTEGIIPNRELQSLSPEEREAMQPGDPVLVAVVQPENNEGHALLSLDRARQERSWRDLQRKFEAGEVIQAPVSGHNKGGLLVNIEGVRGFVPSSQISSLPPGEANKQTELSRYHNQIMPLKIIEINRNRNRLILSERQAMQEQRESMRSRLLKELEPGQVRPGTVTSIADFGAFVDIGGADGLIHLSELSWKRVNDPKDVLHVGDRINVYVLSVDPNERKIALSLKRTQPEPWSTITENYTLGQVVRGTITQLTSFGAFARLDDGIEGLIHVSELAEGRVAHPKNVVKEGDVVELKVIRIDPIKRRIGLSLKRMNEDASSGAGEPGAYGTEGVYEAGAITSQADMSKPGMDVSTEMDPNASPQERALQPGQAPAPEPSQPLSARQAQFMREPQQRDRDRERGRDRDREREPRGGASSSGTVAEEPMSAMAQAFAAFAQQQGSLPLADASDTAPARPPSEAKPPSARKVRASDAAQSAPTSEVEEATTAAAVEPQQSDQAAQSEPFSPVATPPAGEAADAGSTASADSTEASSDANDTGVTTDAETEASMPSSESVETAEESGSGGDDGVETVAAKDATDASASLNDVDTGEVASKAPQAVEAPAGDAPRTDDTSTTDADNKTAASDTNSGAISGAEGMPSVADAEPVDGESGGSGEFNG